MSHLKGNVMDLMGSPGLTGNGILFSVHPISTFWEAYKAVCMRQTGFETRSFAIFKRGVLINFRGAAW